jgi:hypothetical protein
MFSILNSAVFFYDYINTTSTLIIIPLKFFLVLYIPSKVFNFSGFSGLGEKSSRTIKSENKCRNT